MELTVQMKNMCFLVVVDRSNFSKKVAYAAALFTPTTANMFSTRTFIGRESSPVFAGTEEAHERHDARHDVVGIAALVVTEEHINTK